MDEEDVLSNLCTDLVSLARFEPALVYLFQSKRPGEWAPVGELYRRAGAGGAIRPTLAATWLTSPTGQPGSAIVFFCDEDLSWNMTAYYDAERLLGSVTPEAVGGSAPRTPAAPAR